jgi:hypothetical protein
LYGDGSAGAKVISLSGTFEDANPQYTDFTVPAGVTLTVPSGTVIHCTGTFTNAGTIIVSAGGRDVSRFAESGRVASNARSSGQESAGGAGGAALALGVSRSLLRIGLLSAGNGYRDSGEIGGDGGGNFTVICQGAIVNRGEIRANGFDAGGSFRGGGGGGYIVLASRTSISNTGSLVAKGGNGGSLQATDSNSTGHGPGGGGGGGVVHMCAPSIGETGTIDVSGGNGGAAGGPGSVTGLLYLGGGGGGGSGGAGGAGGAVNPGDIGDDSVAAASDGEPGQIVQTAADPLGLF